MSTGTASSPVETRVAELIGRSGFLLLPVLVIAGYRLYRYGLPKDQFPHSLALLIGGIAAFVLIVAYGNLVGSNAKPSWANALTAFGGIVPYVYCLYVMAFLGVWPLVQLVTEPPEGSLLLGAFGLVAGYGTLRAFWQITELGNSATAPIASPAPQNIALTKAQVERMLDILDRYGALIETDGPSGEIIDESVLPYPKTEIKVALCLALSSATAPEDLRSAYRVGLVLLAQYQPGVGPERLWPSGLDQRCIPKTIANDPASREKALAQMLAASNENNKRRYELFRPQVEAEQMAFLELSRSIQPGRYGTWG